MAIRKKKEALLKVLILEQTLKMVGQKAFKDIFVSEICAKTKISKVTFFNYFPQKEDLLLYYFRRWCLERVMDLKAKPLEGLKGIYFLMDKFCEAYEKNTGFMLSLVAYLSDMNRIIKPYPLKLEEKKLFFPEEEDMNSVELLSLDQMVEKFVLEAIFKKEITKTSSTRDVANLFVAAFWGSAITANLVQANPVKYLFRRNFDLIISGLQ